MGRKSTVNSHLVNSCAIIIFNRKRHKRWWEKGRSPSSSPISPHLHFQTHKSKNPTQTRTTSSSNICSKVSLYIFTSAWVISSLFIWSSRYLSRIFQVNTRKRKKKERKSRIRTFIIKVSFSFQFFLITINLMKMMIVSHSNHLE